MPNSPSDGALVHCRKCEKTFRTYGGRYNHEKKEHNMHRKLTKFDDVNKKPEMNNNNDLVIETNTTENIIDPEVRVIDIEVDNKPLVPVKLESDGFPKIDKDKFDPTEVLYNDGGPVYLMIKSVARIMSLVGDEDYLKALEPVDKHLKSACSKLTGRALGEMTPLQQVILLMFIAWLPLILMDIPNFIIKFRLIKDKLSGDKNGK